MQHSHQDALDTYERRARDQRPRWHPMLAARENPAGTWYMVDSRERCFGVIRLVRRGGEVGYRLDSWAPDPGERQALGYFRTLRAACERAHSELVRLSSLQQQFAHRRQWDTEQALQEGRRWSDR